MYGPTHRIGTKIARGTRDRPNVPSALDYVDSVDVVGVDDARTADATHQLREDVRRHLAPGEVTQRRKGKSHRRVNVAA